MQSDGNTDFISHIKLMNFTNRNACFSLPNKNEYQFLKKFAKKKIISRTTTVKVIDLEIEEINLERITNLAKWLPYVKVFCHFHQSSVVTVVSFALKNKNEWLRRSQNRKKKNRYCIR